VKKKEKKRKKKKKREKIVFSSFGVLIVTAFTIMLK